MTWCGNISILRGMLMLLHVRVDNPNLLSGVALRVCIYFEPPPRGGVGDWGVLVGATHEPVLGVGCYFGCLRGG